MRTADYHFELPSFDELKSSDFNPPSSSGQKQAVRDMSVIAPVPDIRKLKAAAYCRVSTDNDDQKSSIRIQKEHFRTVAQKNSGWQFVGIYADIVSGTKKEKRPELNRLLADCAAGKVNLVLTKSVSRFARNTTDLLEMVRSLTAAGTGIFFERENIDTRTMDSEFFLTILASLAEDESHSISANCRWGLQRRFEDGSYRAASAPYGYDLADGSYAVNETEAEIVREIFQRAADGEAFARIAADLNDRGIPTKRDGQVWNGKAIHPEWEGRSISTLLRNEAYVGEQILQKCYTDRNFRMCRNTGQYPQFRHKDHHPAIISRETFEAVQEMLEANRPKKPQAEKKASVLSGMLRCGCCGANLTKNKNRAGNVYWICSRHRKKASACGLPGIPEDQFISAFSQMIMDLHADDSVVREYLDSVRQEYRNDFRVDAIGKKIRDIDTEIAALSNTQGRIRPADYRSRQNALEAEREKLRGELDKISDNRICLTEELLSLIHSAGGSFDFERTFLQAAEGVTIQGRGIFTVRFRCGLAVEYDGR